MTTILFPILTFSMVLILGICIGIFISSQLEKKIQRSIKDISKNYFTYIDENGNTLRCPIQTNTFNQTITLKEFQSKKIKLNRYEMDYLLKNIEDHLNNVGETYEENEHIQELFKNLINKETNHEQTKSKTGRKRKKKN